MNVWGDECLGGERLTIPYVYLIIPMLQIYNVVMRQLIRISHGYEYIPYSFFILKCLKTIGLLKLIEKTPISNQFSVEDSMHSYMYKPISFLR